MCKVARAITGAGERSHAGHHQAGVSEARAGDHQAGSSKPPG
ncbi:MAG TPA: hypothetical protein VIZ43_22105 [Trebonia sp.]